MKLLSLDALKAPKVGRLRLPARSGAPSVKAPQIVTDLYRDLRDRHLLPVAILLVVGIAAVPLLLHGSSIDKQASVAPQSAAVLSSEAALSSQPAVVVSNPGLRDYHRRLLAFREKNPFEQQLTKADMSKATQSLGSDVQSTVSAIGTTPTTSTGSSTGSISGSDSATSSGGSTQSFPITTGGGSGSGSSGTATKTTVKTVNNFVEYNVDVRFGVHGKAKRHSGVKALTMLPSEKKPVTAFLGMTDNHKGAVFLVSSNVGSFFGDGSCIPNGPDCQFLTLKVGQSELLGFDDPNDSGSKLVTYNLELLKIRKNTTKAG